MKIEHTEKHAVVREGYQILLRIDAELLIPVEKPLMREFYHHLTETCITWARSVYGEGLRKEFLGLESVRERSQFGSQHYQLSMSVPWESDGLAAILCESKLTGQWKEPQKSYHRISHVWNTEEETILPIAQILSTFGIKLSQEKLPFRPDGIYPVGEELVVFRNVSDQSPFLEHRLTREAGA